MEDIGTCTIERKWDAAADSYTTRVARADRSIRISRELLDYVRSLGLRNHLTLDGDVLTIRDDYGQRFIYRIHWDDYADGGYLAEWPD